MPPVIATMIFVVGILGLFVLDRDKISQTSKALWIPVLWMLIIGSRPVSVWVQNQSPTLGQGADYLDGSPVDRLVFVCLLVAGLVVLAFRGKRVSSLLRGNGPLLLFFLYCAASISWSDYPDVAFRRWVKAVGDITMIVI